MRREPNWAVGNLNCGFTPRRRASCLASAPWCTRSLSNLRTVGTAVPDGLFHRDRSSLIGVPSIAGDDAPFHELALSADLWGIAPGRAQHASTGGYPAR